MSKLDDLTRPLSMAADTIDDVLAGRPARFSWQELLSGKRPGAGELRRFIEVQPVLDYSALEPGRVSSDAIRKAAVELGLASHYQARVRLTGSVPMGDEEFATVQEGTLVNGIGTVLVVLVILWLALKSGRIIFAVFVNLAAGLAITAALGLMMVGALNMISVAFAVLFVGLGVDFGIQFSVRYRAERHDTPSLRGALKQTALHIGVPLTLAAAAVAAGFLSFLPTAYRGLSELGAIAGVGMLIAYLTSITLLPALLTVLNPPGEPEEVGYRALAPVDKFMQRNRIAVVGGTVAVALLGSPLLYHLSFDFDPIHLRSPAVESVATYLDIENDPSVGANAINIIAPSLAKADETAVNLRKLPEVAAAMSLSSLVPPDQPQKLSMIHDLDRRLGPILQPAGIRQYAERRRKCRCLEGDGGAVECSRRRGERPRRRCRQAPGRRSVAAGGWRQGPARSGAGDFHRSLAGRSCAVAQLSAGERHHPRQSAERVEAAAGWRPTERRARR